MRKKSSSLDIALVLFMPAAIILMLYALWWTQELSRTVHIAIMLGFFTAVAAAGLWADVRREQRQDEIQIAAIRFGHRWSSVGIFVLIAASFLPPFHGLIVDLAGMFEERADSYPPPAVSVFVFGLAAAQLIQQLAASMLRAAWLQAKARP
jgi:hypothetical protein